MGKLFEAPLECLEVLKTEYGGRRKHCDLLAILHRFERRSHRNFGLPVAHVAAQQTIHRHRRFHVAFDIRDSRQLIVGFVVIECILELALKLIVRRKGVALGRLAQRVEFEQLVSHVLHGFLDPGLRLGPLLRPKAIQNCAQAPHRWSGISE